MPSWRRSENARRATADVARSRWSATRLRPRRWTLPAEWKSAETSARRQQPRAGSIDASSERSSSESAIALEGEEAALVLDAEGAVAADPAGRDDPVARHEEREAVLGAERAGGTGGASTAGERRQLAVADDLAPGNRAQRARERCLEWRAPVLVERNVRERDPLAREVAVETSEQIRYEAVALALRLPR